MEYKSPNAINFQMLAALFSNMDDDQKIAEINHIREFLHNHSPFKREPVDFVKWVKSDNVVSRAP